MKQSRYNYISAGAARKAAYRVAAGKPTAYHFHQTLTSGDNDFQHDETVALARLHKLLDWLRKAYPNVTGDWALESQPERGGYHFQLILRAYDERRSPATFFRAFRRDVFAEWSKLNRKVEQDGNKMTMRDDIRIFGVENLAKSYGYIFKSFRLVPRAERTARTVKRFGHHNNHIHWSNARPLTKQEKLASFRILFPVRRDHKNHRVARLEQTEPLRIVSYIDSNGCPVWMVSTERAYHRIYLNLNKLWQIQTTPKVGKFARKWTGMDRHGQTIRTDRRL